MLYVSPPYSTLHTIFYSVLGSWESRLDTRYFGRMHADTEQYDLTTFSIKPAPLLMIIFIHQKLVAREK